MCLSQHPNFNNLTQSFSFNHTQIYPYGLNNTALMWGLVDYNAILFPAGLTGNVNNEFLFGKSPDFTFSQGWPYPRVNQSLPSSYDCLLYVCISEYYNVGKRDVLWYSM